MEASSFAWYGSMSRIGKMIIPIPSGVEIKYNDSTVSVKGPKGELSQTLLPEVDVCIEDGVCTVKRINDQKRSKQLHGLYRQLVYNMVQGVSVGFEKKLQLVGVGYRAEVKQASIVFNLGYSMPIEYVIPSDVSISVEGQDIVVVQGISKERVGQIASEIRSLRKPEPYKGKGVKYINEIIQRKEGKSAAKK